jgi:hypothetical protein
MDILKPVTIPAMVGEYMLRVMDAVDDIEEVDRNFTKIARIKRIIPDHLAWLVVDTVKGMDEDDENIIDTLFELSEGYSRRVAQANKED